MNKKTAFEIPNILESYAIDVITGQLTLHEAAKELAAAGWNLGRVSDEYTAKALTKALRELEAKYLRYETE